MALTWIAAALLVLLVLDRLLLAAERAGWLYYRKRKPTSGSASAAAFGAVTEFLEPGRTVVVEEINRQRVTRRTAESSDPAESAPEQDDADAERDRAHDLHLMSHEDVVDAPQPSDGRGPAQHYGRRRHKDGQQDADE